VGYILKCLENEHSIFQFLCISIGNPNFQGPFQAFALTIEVLTSFVYFSKSIKDKYLGFSGGDLTHMKRKTVTSEF